MRIRVNGTEKEFADGLSAREIVAALGAETQHMAVAVNGEIARREHLDTIIIRDRDEVDIIKAVAGG